MYLEGHENIMSGFYVKLMPGRPQLRHWGYLFDWEIFSLPESTEYCAFSIDAGVLFIRAK
jgi:hypothetical protein